MFDSSVRLRNSYIYRVFAENIFGTLSPPAEIEVTSTDSKVTAPSRSNTFKIPIVNAVQDQNSDFIKITISPNDPKVSYYILERQDLTIFEKDFRKPSQIYTNYGGPGWDSHIFFVEKQRNTTNTTTQKESDLLNRDIDLKEINFVDDTTQEGHLYRYRVKGVDLFGNVSSYSFSTVRATGKKSLRQPINLRTTIVRNNPLRLRIQWDDDNLAQQLSGDDTPGLYFSVQRRAIDESSYKTFPLTPNSFIVDEEASSDAVSMNPEDQAQVPAKQPDTPNDEGTTVVRPFNIPSFLLRNKFYYYRVAVVSSDGEESNYTQEFKVSALPELTNVLNFKVEVLNTKVRPLVARLSWTFEELKAKPDYVIIERKLDSEFDVFSEVGRAYIDNLFYDHDIESGNRYIYRIRAVDTLGRESEITESRLTL
jgi:hypothetical protein